MMPLVRPATPIVRGQPNRLRMVHLAAPIGGDDTVSPGVEMPPENTIFTYNMIGAEYGLRARLGWREWVTGLDGEVRSLLPFSGSTSAGSRLFACTQTGIWDCTSSTAAPTEVVTFGTQNSDSGWGICTAFTDANGAHWLCYCDEANGYYTYAESGATWTKVTQGGGASQIANGDPTKFVFVCAWKNRLWFVEKDSQKAWYLPLNALYGSAASFMFGSRFKAGGDLRGLWSWTGDGGRGIDDRLVAVSGGGDVVIYEGTDPSQASGFYLAGVWFVGSVPAGRRICTDFGGDLLVMSSTGILPISKLVIGNIIYDRSQYSTFRISNLFNQMVSATGSQRGWAMRLHPLDSALLVIVPTSSGQPTQQLVMSLITRGWHRYRNLPMGLCAEPWNGTLWFGTADGRVCANDGYLDGVLLSNANAYSPVNWSMLTSFQNLGSPQWKRIQQISVRVLSQGGAIPVNAEARFGFDFSEAAAPIGQPGAGGSVWDTAVWDTSLWAGAYQTQRYVFGGAGMGTEMAVAIRGAATSRMTLTGIDVEYDVGGVR